jgi:hypothetical protein
MRSQLAIEKRAKKQFNHDNTGFEWTMYIPYLSYERAIRIVPTLPRDEWQAEHDMVTSKPVLQQMREYMPFAKKKAAEGRNLSSQRSLRHYVAWFWLLGQEEMADSIEKYLLHQYKDFGKEMLYFIEKAIKEEDGK